MFLEAFRPVWILRDIDLPGKCCYRKLSDIQSPLQVPGNGPAFEYHRQILVYQSEYRNEKLHMIQCPTLSTAKSAILFAIGLHPLAIK